MLASGTFFVTSTAQLVSAYQTLSNTSGGQILLTDEFPPNEVIYLDGGGDATVRITSANTTNPVQIGQIDLNGVKNVEFSHLEVNSAELAKAEFEGDLNVMDCEGIVFDEMTLTSDGSLFYSSSDGDYVNGGRGVLIRGSEDITLTNSTLSGHYKGVIMLQSKDVTLEGNEFAGIQGDGIVISEMKGALIKNNYLHDFAFTPNNVNHCDFIQMHAGAAATIGTENVTITGNVMDTGNNSSVQGIWMTSRKYEATGNESDLFKNITVTENLIYTASANGIGLDTVDGGLIANNTLLYNPQAFTEHPNGNTSFEPRIRVGDDASNVIVTDNITPGMVPTSGGVSEVGNIIISYDDPDASNFVGNHFTNVVNGGDIDWQDWQLLEGSAWVGKGAEATQPNGLGGDDSIGKESENNSIEDDYVGHGLIEGYLVQDEPAHEEQTRGVLFHADFRNGIVEDLSEYKSTFRDSSVRNLSIENGDGAYEIGQGKLLRLSVENEQLHGLDSFGLELDMRVFSAADYGRFLHFPRAFEAVIEKDGSVTFSLTTDVGNYTVNSGISVFGDLEVHNFAVGYDNGSGFLSMVVDGVVVDRIEASGTTAEGLHHGLSVGTIWGNSVEALFGDIFVSRDPFDAGVDVSLEAVETFFSSDASGRNKENGVFNPEILADPSDALFAMNFDGDFIFDSSPYNSRLKNPETHVLTQNANSQGYTISDSERITLQKSNTQIHELDSFGIRVDIQLLENTETGRFIHFPRSFEAQIEDDRSVSFTLITNEGIFSVNSGAPVLDDLAMHSFAVGYDDENGRLTMEIDGAVVDSVAASGSTSEMVHHGLTIGSIWGDSATAFIDNVWFAESSADVGVDNSPGFASALTPNTVIQESLDEYRAEVELLPTLFLDYL